jgi:hypothetical protein
LIGFASLGLTATGCQPPSETTREKGVTDSSGHALIRAFAPGENHHWSIDVTLRSAAAGTYAVLFTTTEPAGREWFVIAPNDPALGCAAGRAKGCSIPEHGDVVAVTTIGPGGTGVLRATFAVGAGGWFRVMRIEDRAATAAPFDVRIVSESFSKDEEAYRFTIEQLR